MKMQILASNNSYGDDDMRNLEHLFEAFGSVVSLEDIASAYCQAGRDLYTAGELLSNHQESDSCIFTSASKDDLEGASSSSEWLTDNISGKSYVERNSTSAKQRKSSASMGTVSGVIGREYANARGRASNKEPCKVTKPLKLDSTELPATEIWGEEACQDDVATNKTMKKDFEAFLCIMLGDGFQLDMKVIQEVLGLCGYDVNKSMEKLLDLSALTLEKSEDVLCMTTHKPMEKSLEVEILSSAKTSLGSDSGESRGTVTLTGSESKLPKKHKDMYDLEKEVLRSLFTVPERIEAPTKVTRSITESRRSRAFGSVVVEPLIDTTTDFLTSAKPKVTKDDETDENEEIYIGLRKAAKEYWLTMKEYYKSASDAFVKGDRTLADKLMKEGHFFAKKARDANDMSAQKLCETSDEKEGVPLDLHDHSPKEAIRSLKCHLTSLSGIPSIQHLKVLVGTNENDTKRAACKKRIIELLERDSIKWSEEGNGQIIVIRVDEINPKRLSFAKAAPSH